MSKAAGSTSAADFLDQQQPLSRKRLYDVDLFRVLLQHPVQQRGHLRKIASIVVESSPAARRQVVPYETKIVLDPNRVVIPVHEGEGKTSLWREVNLPRILFDDLNGFGPGPGDDLEDLFLARALKIGRIVFSHALPAGISGFVEVRIEDINYVKPLPQGHGKRGELGCSAAQEAADLQEVAIDLANPTPIKKLYQPVITYKIG
jgi:hypothetical protein